jgi:hypothetical protein
MAGLILVGGVTLKSAAPDPGGTQGHLAGLQARITLPDGATRMAKLDGIGCTSSICSRVAIKGLLGSTAVKLWLDNIVAIRDINQEDALVVMKNGAENRMALITDFRVLYLRNRSGSYEKLDLAKIKSLEFVTATK